MSARVSVEAVSVPAFVEYLATQPRDLRATITATEQGTPWATVTVAPAGELRTVFPNFLDSTAVGDSRRVAHAGARFGAADARRALGTVVERARRMALAEVAR